MPGFPATQLCSTYLANAILNIYDLLLWKLASTNASPLWCHIVEHKWRYKVDFQWRYFCHDRFSLPLNYVQPTLPIQPLNIYDLLLRKLASPNASLWWCNIVKQNWHFNLDFQWRPFCHARFSYHSTMCSLPC